MVTNKDLCSKENINVLSLNGGGVRGYVSSLILKQMEQELREQTGDKDARIIDLFDLVCGTSAGSISAAALVTPNEDGTYKFSASDLPTICTNTAAKVFPRKTLATIQKGIFGHLYSSDELEELVHSNIGDTKMYDVLTHLQIFAYDEHHRGLKIFSSMDTFDNYKLADTVVASSSAQTFLPAKNILEQSCVDACKKSEPAAMFKNISCEKLCTFTYSDGGILANSPASSCYAYMVDQCKNEGYNISKDNVNIVAIGTGKVDFKTNKAYLTKGNIKAVMGKGNIISKILDARQDTDDWQASQVLGDKYLSYNPFINKKNKDFTNSKKSNLKELKHTTQEYLDSAEISKSITALIKALNGFDTNVDQANTDLKVAKQFLRSSDKNYEWIKKTHKYRLADFKKPKVNDSMEELEYADASKKFNSAYQLNNLPNYDNIAECTGVCLT